MHLAVTPGPRIRFGEISAEGNASVSDRVVLRELPFRTGDWFSTSAVAEGRTRLQAVDLLSHAVVDVDSQPAPDSTLGVRIRIEESRPRLTLAEVGYISEGAGLTGRVQWTHPNFTGGARSLTASLEGQSGGGAIGTEAEQLLRVSLSLTQPYVFTPRLSFIVGPWAEYRNDLHDQSGAIGIDATLVYRLAALSSIALGYRFSARHIDEYHFGDVYRRRRRSPGAPRRALPAPDRLAGARREPRAASRWPASFNRVDDLSDPDSWVAAPPLGGGHGARRPGARRSSAGSTSRSPGFSPWSKSTVLAAPSHAGSAVPVRQEHTRRRARIRPSPSFACATSR